MILILVTGLVAIAGAFCSGLWLGRELERQHTSEYLARLHGRVKSLTVTHLQER